MDNLNNIPSTGNFGDVAEKLNDNFNKVNIAVETINSKYIKNKGYFPTLAALQASFPSPKIGDTAYVANVASSSGYYFANVVSGAWVETTTVAPAMSINASEYAKHGYTNTPKTLKQVEDDAVMRLINLITNGNFVNDRTGWIFSANITGTSVADNILSFIGGGALGASAQNWIMPMNLTIFPEGHVLYNIATARSLMGAIFYVGIGYSSSTFVLTDQWGTYSHLGGFASNNYPTYGAELGKTVEMTNAMCFDLTGIFGAGNEPTKGEMDLLISTLGIYYFEGEITIPIQKIMQWQLCALALKANHGYESNPKTLKEVDDDLVQLAGEVNNFWSFKSNGYVEVNRLDSTFTIKNIRVASTKTGVFLEGNYVINTDNSKHNQYIIADVSTGVLNISLGTENLYWQDDFNDSKMLFAYQNDGFWNSPIPIIQQQLPFLDNKNINWCVGSGSITIDGDNITFKSPIYITKKSEAFCDVSQTYTFNCPEWFDYIIISGITGTDAATMTMRKGTQTFWWKEIDNLGIDETILCFKTLGKWNSLYSNVAIALHEATKHHDVNYSPKADNSIVFSSDFNTLTLKDIDAQRGKLNYGTATTFSFDVSADFCYIKFTGFSEDGSLVPALGTADYGQYWRDEVATTEVFAYKYFGKWYSKSPQIQMLLDKAIAKVIANNEAKVLVPKQNMMSYIENNNINADLYANCYFAGKWFKKVVNSKDCTVTINQGSEFYMLVENTTKVDLNLINTSSTGNNPYISVSIDGGEYVRYMESTGEHVLNIASGLSLSKHYIRVVIDGLQESDNKWIGGVGFTLNSITVDSGGTVKSIRPRNRKIEFIGDSITEGINVRGVGAIPVNNSGQLSYPYITCRNLNAVSLRDGFGASGATHGGSGGVPSAIDTIDWAMSGVPLIMDEPDFIVINHGTNDSASTNLDFESAYDALLKALQSKYPGKLIFCMIPFNQTKAASITLVSVNNNCILVPTTGWGITYSDGGHPDIAGGEIAGAKLAQFIVDKVGISYFLS